jgi:hypothetical protein
VTEPERGRLRRHVGAPDVLGRGVLEYTVDDAGSIEAGHHRDSTRNRAGRVAAVFLHPSQIQLDVWPGRGEWIETAFGAPVQVGA